MKSFLRSHRIDQERRQKISESYNNNMPKAFSRNTYFMSNLYFKKCHSTGKSIGDQPCTFASFPRLLVFAPTREGRVRVTMRGTRKKELSLQVANRVLALRFVQWIGWVFENKERKKEITNQKPEKERKRGDFWVFRYFKGIASHKGW